MNAAVLRVLALMVVGLALVAGCGAPPATTEPAPANSAPTATAPVPAVAAPASVELPSLGVGSSLERTGLNPDNTIEVPPVDEPLQASYFDAGPAPGEVGPAILLGHVDGAGQQGIFFGLKDLRAGDPVRITLVDGTVLDYAVYATEQVSKQAFPWDRVTAPLPVPELVLITCGGSFDPAEDSYRDNLIVRARLA